MFGLSRQLLGQVVDALKGPLGVSAPIELVLLEDRRLMSVTTVDGGLVIVGEGTTISVERGGDGKLVVLDGGNGAIIQPNDAANLTRIDITGTANNDTISIDSTCTLPATIHGGAGDDAIFAGGGNTTVYGGSGNDVITGGSGNDDLYGDDGDDVIDGGSGSDLVDGGYGDDSLQGGNGNDYLAPGPGQDTVYGGDGDDWVESSADGDSDYINGGQGTDRIDESDPWDDISGFEGGYGL